MGNTRTTGTEQYYTPAEVAERLTKTMVSIVDRPHERIWIEPAAGTGAFSIAMRKAGISQILAWDIEPKAAGIEKGSFLDVVPETLDLRELGAVCLTNPPFGRNHALSIPFFNHAARFCDYIGFIVPKSWRKWSVVNRLDQNMHLIHDEELDINYVDDQGQPLTKNKTLKTIFQVWEKRPVTRARIVVEDRGYIQKCSPEEADVAVCVFGYGCGTVHVDFPRQKNTTLMFLKAAPQVIEALQQVDFSRFYNNVAYVEALSLPEIQHLLNEYFDTHPDKDPRADRQDSSALRQAA